MSNETFTIEIQTEDSDFLSALRNENFDGVRLMTRTFICDSPDWIPPVERILTYIVETSDSVVWSLLAAWLYDRFKAKPPEKIIINNITVSSFQEMVTVINEIELANGEPIKEKSSDNEARDL